jgi:serine/threonine protein kinase
MVAGCGIFEVMCLKISRSFVLMNTMVFLLVIILLQPVSAAGILPAAGAGVASRTFMERTGILFTPFVTSLVLFAVLSGISAVLILFFRQRYPEESRHQHPGIPHHFTLLAAGAYIILGSILAVLTILTMTALLAATSASLAITGGKLVCALCVYLSVSSFFLAYSVLHAESFPAITGMHGVLAALAIPGFAFLMIITPERRESALFLLIVVLVSSAVLSFWQYRRHPQPQSLPGAVVDGKTPPVSARPSATVVYPVISGTGSQDRKSASPSPAGPESSFPVELKGKYYDISCRGSGGFAMVFSANRISDGEKVAVKIPLSFNEATGKSFLNEIRVWETLHHPNIVEVSQVNILPVPYVEMEYIPESLDAIHKPVPIAQTLKIIRQIADALSYAHGLGIIHRDIKPHNILMTHDMIPRITDWGMSKVLSGGDKKKSTIIGYSLEYAAPEQISPSEFGKTDQRTDIYQLGVVFYELVTGSVPFAGESIADTGDAILHKMPPLPSEHNPEAVVVDAIIKKCLEKEPSRRFQSATELIDALVLVESGKLRMEYADFSLGELLTKILDTGEYAMKADIVTEVPRDLRFEGDANKIAIVLDTLLSNAVEYSKPPRKIRVTYQSSPDDSYHRLAVQDNGVGITGSRLDIIFKPPRAPDQVRPGGRYEKTGVSLALAKKYIQMHGGYISVDSVVNVGSTFTLHIPKIPPEM